MVVLDHLYPFIQAQQNVALIILGDLQLTTPHELEKLAQHCDLWFIHGNHDSKTISAFEAIWGKRLAITQLTRQSH
ncbi:metallophosphoesterase [Pasteurella canis]|uniref:Metallophosphoesterase n=1 Tax=Pasteurella canis TaxID=753 RepID=A0A379ERV7_9PAST|nr:metallophosphoesterase [Pasteurella canis]